MYPHWIMWWWSCLCQLLPARSGRERHIVVFYIRSGQAAFILIASLVIPEMLLFRHLHHHSISLVMKAKFNPIQGLASYVTASRLGKSLDRTAFSTFSHTTHKISCPKQRRTSIRLYQSADCCVWSPYLRSGELVFMMLSKQESTSKRMRYEVKMRALCRIRAPFPFNFPLLVLILLAIRKTLFLFY